MESLEQQDPDSYYQNNAEFHLVIYKASGNSLLASEALRLQRRIRPYRRMPLRAQGRLEQSMKEHTIILQALQNEDQAAAADALRNHVSIQGERFQELIASYKTGVQA